MVGTTTYTYDPAGNRKTITDAENRTTTYDYDALNRAITTTNALGGQTVVVYDEVGNRKQSIDANGHATTYEYDSLYRMTSATDAENQTTTMTYDALGNRKTVTDPENHTTTFSYDSLNRMVQTTNPLSGTTSVTYNALGNRLTATDANNHTVTYQYDDLNRPVRVTDANNLTTVTTYDSLGNRLSVTNGANETTEFEYDQANRLVLTRDPLGNETRYRYNGAGNRVAMIDAEGVETRYGYDDLGRLTSVIENYSDGVYDPVVTDEDVKTEYRYDKVGNRTRIIDARDNETIYVYDDLNRRIEVRDPLGNATLYGYDQIGNRTVITDANGVVTLFDYDRVNRLETIDYADTTPDVSFTYDAVGNRIEMIDGTGVTTYTYDALYRLKGVNDGAGLQVGYGYDAVGNRTRLIYPDSKEVTYTYDDGNRLDTVTDWKNGQFGYNYDDANRLLDLTLPNGVTSDYDYDDAGRLTLLTHSNITETLASYDYALDNVGNRTTLTEALVAVQDVPAGAYLESDGLVVMEAENGQVMSTTTHTWLTATAQSGYTGTSYLQALPDIDALYQTNEMTNSARTEYAVNFTTPGTYTVWLRGYASSAAGDSAYVKLDDDVVNVTGFAPHTWEWADGSASVVVESSGLKTIRVLMREDGLRVDRLLLTTDTNFIPSDFGPVESQRQGEATNLIVNLDRTITYQYDDLYRLTNADYTSGEAYEYSYDPVGNRLQQIINGDTTDYLYDAANRLAAVDGQSYTFDNNGNLLATGVMTNVFDTANRLIETNRDGTALQPVYNGIGDRVAQTIGVTTTYFALDVIGLPEVIQTSEGNSYLHLPGVIVAESAGGEVRYLLSDGLGSVRQAVDEGGQIVNYREYDSYGNPIGNPKSEILNPYGYTGEWWENEMGLLHLRARWYLPETGTFLSVDPVESEPPYLYVRGNPINLIDPFGEQGGPPGWCPPGTGYCPNPWLPRDWGELLEPLENLIPPPLRKLNALLGFPEFCRNKNTKTDYAECVLRYYGLEPARNPDTGIQEIDTSQVTGSGRGCWGGPVPYRAWGYIEGTSLESGILGTFNSGFEVVYDFAAMERQQFIYGGFGANKNSPFNPGASLNVNIAYAWGFNSNQMVAKDYTGPFYTYYLGRGIKGAKLISVGLMGFNAPDWSIYGYGAFFSVGGSLNDILEEENRKGLSKDPWRIPTLPGGPYGGAYVNYTPIPNTHHQYGQRGDSYIEVSLGKLAWDILSGFPSPMGPRMPLPIDPVYNSRMGALFRARIYAELHDQIYIDSQNE